jgi:hypothetical protein
MEGQIPGLDGKAPLSVALETMFPLPFGARLGAG